jgi:hypothetical protein
MRKSIIPALLGNLIRYIDIDVFDKHHLDKITNIFMKLSKENNN